MTVRVSIVLPCRNEVRYIGRCLDSILATTYPHQRIEVLVVDGMSDDGTRAIVERYAEGCPMLRLIDNPKGIVPTALNAGVRAARGDIIMRMDAHVAYPPDYVPRLVAALDEFGADNVGGCIATRPAHDTPVARAIAYALGHPFGVGNAYFRVGVRTARWVDTVPFGCFRREVFHRVGLFDEELVRNQDDEFNHRLVRRGGRILLLPDVVSHYYARGSFAQLARMYLQYGLFKPLAAYKVGAVVTVRQIVPAAFLLSLVALGVAGTVWPGAAVALGIDAGTYALLVAGTAVWSVRRLGARAAVALAAAFPVVHLSYAVGFLQGAWRLARRRSRGTLDPATVRLSR